MLICLDVGNTHILGGIYDGEKLVQRFRYATQQIGTSDQFGIFIRNFLQTHRIDGEVITGIALSSVVPGCNYTIRHAMTNYFPRAEYFILQAGAKTGINIRYKNPAEVGADLIAGSIGGINAFPHKNLIIADLGTATTLCAVTKNSDYLGGIIMPGMRLAMESLKTSTAKLMEVDIETPTTYLGQSTRECIQRGLFFGHLGAMREIIAGYRQELFPREDVTVIGTGGFSHLFREHGVFDVILPDLVLDGIRIAFDLNKQPAAA